MRMDGIELTTVLLAIFTAIIAIIISIFFQRQQKKDSKDLMESINRIFSPTSPNTFQAIVKLFTKRRNEFKKIEKDLVTGTQEPWITDLSKIVKLRRQKEGGE
jgi:hypothetical protein